MEKIRIAVFGAAGRMGRRIVALAAASDRFEVTGALESPGNPALNVDSGTLAGVAPNGVPVTDSLEAGCRRAQVAVDFTSPRGTIEHVRGLPAGVRGLVAGATGMTAAEVSEMRAALRPDVACVCSPNMSVGVNLMFSLVREAARVLKDSYDVEIVEWHHNQKKDAPSGTARRFGEIIAESQGTRYEDRVQHGREGICPRVPGQIGMHAVRAGEIVGEHSILFGGCGELVEFHHTALSRDAFAQGALVAARFASQAAPGWYSMEDVFNLRKG